MAKRIGEKYDAIINAAVKVIASNGYHNAKVSQIAKQAGVADGTIYLYFENKDDVLISMFNEKISRFVDDVRSRLAAIDSPEDKLKELVRMHFTFLTTDPNMAIVTQIELRQSDRASRVEIGKVVKTYLDIIDELIEDGVKAGAFRQGMDVRLARKMIFGTLDEMVTSWVMKDMKYDLTALADPIFEMFLKGIST
jgi:TetR/AcrR family fatty acid metabolism transcriptional regulator